ncbi:hypothetical protein FBUS_05729, partial [Fasciolopsis buskii]
PCINSLTSEIHNPASLYLCFKHSVDCRYYRIGQAASMEGHLPVVFSMLHVKQQSPIPSMIGLVSP